MSTENGTFDVIVIGSGVVGLSIADALGGAGVSTLCIGQVGDSASMATSAAGAMLGAFGEVTASAVSAVDLVELDTRVTAARSYPAFIDKLRDITGIVVPNGDGTIVIANMTNGHDRRNLAAIQASAQRYGTEAESVDPVDVPGLRPADGYEVVEALFLSSEGWVDTRELLNALRKSVLTSASSHLLTANVRRLRQAGGRVTGVELENDLVLSAGTVVVAAGAGTQRILRQLENSMLNVPPLLICKGVGIRVTGAREVFPYAVRTPNRDFSCGTHLIPFGNGRLYLGATNRMTSPEGSGTAATIGEISAIVHSALHEINAGLSLCDFADASYGLRSLSSDRYPVVGATAVPGLMVAAGTYRNGVLLAPIVADFVKSEILESGSVCHNPFRPNADFRSSPVVEQHSATLKNGVGDLVSYILHPDKRLSHNKKNELCNFLSMLMRVALLGEEVEEVQQAREVLEKYPVAETIPYLFNELSRRSD